MTAGQWRGHPWGYVDDHRPVGHGQAICAGCDERCSEQVGCMCCCESAHEWLLAERTWQRDQARQLCADLLDIYAPELARIDWDAQTLTVTQPVLDEIQP